MQEDRENGPKAPYVVGFQIQALFETNYPLLFSLALPDRRRGPVSFFELRGGYQRMKNSKLPSLLLCGPGATLLRFLYCFTFYFFPDLPS